MHPRYAQQALLKRDAQAHQQYASALPTDNGARVLVVLVVMSKGADRYACRKHQCGRL